MLDFERMFYNRLNSAAMETDIIEYEDKYVLYCNLPGVAKENISIEMEEDILRITVNIPQNTTEEEKYRICLRERETGRHFGRGYLIPDVDATKITAKLSDGVLTVMLPKLQYQKPAAIKIL